MELCIIMYYLENGTDLKNERPIVVSFKTHCKNFLTPSTRRGAGVKGCRDFSTFRLCFHGWVYIVGMCLDVPGRVITSIVVYVCDLWRDITSFVVNELRWPFWIFMGHQSKRRYYICDLLSITFHLSIMNLYFDEIEKLTNIPIFDSLICGPWGSGWNITCNALKTPRPVRQKMGTILKNWGHFENICHLKQLVLP